MAEDTRADLQAMHVPLHDAREARISVSIGVASFSECAWQRKALIHVGDERLYRAKHLDRTRIVCDDHCDDSAD